MSLLAQALDELGVRAQTRILAITGTNGKTTTTALTAALAQSAGVDAVAAGNISPAGARRADGAPRDRRRAAGVLGAQLSSFQIETMHALDPEAATVLNVTDDHLDRYADLDAYAATKAAIFQGQGRAGAESRGRARGGDGAARPAHGSARYHAAGARHRLRAGRRRWPDLADARTVNACSRSPTCRSPAVTTPPTRWRRSHCAKAGWTSSRVASSTACLPSAACHTGSKWSPARQRAAVSYTTPGSANVGATVAALAGMDCPVVLIAGGERQGSGSSPRWPRCSPKARARGADRPRRQAHRSGGGRLRRRARACRRSRRRRAARRRRTRSAGRCRAARRRPAPASTCSR